jgi:dTDP-4-amino-4,6-dideoxygalactose transaminase
LAGCFSFFSNKPLGVGEGGAIATDSEEVAARARSLRSHAMTAGTWDRHRGHAETYDVADLGFNYRIDEQRAAMLAVRLGGLDANIRRRNELIARYRSELGSFDGLRVAYADADPATSSGYLMLVLLDEPESRPELRARLRDEHGVQTTVFPAVHRFTAYGGEKSETLPRTETAASSHLVLPLFPHMSEEQQDTVVAALRAELG